MDTVFVEKFDGIVIDRCIRDYEYTMANKHFHDEYEVYYLLKGERYYFIEKQVYLVEQGSLVFIDRNHIHKTSVAGSPYHDRILIGIKEEAIRDMAELAGLQLEQFFLEFGGVIRLKEEERKRVEALLFDLAEEIHDKTPGYEFMVKTKLVELFVLTRRFYKSSQTSSSEFTAMTALTAKHKKVHEIAEYLNQNYHKTELLHNLAERFFISKCYLSRIFKEATGFTINEYIHVQRIKQAKLLLADSKYNITGIAERIGYDSITYFERVFKQYTDMTPLTYRKKEQKGRVV